MKRTFLFVLLIASFLLAACGGGGSGEANQTSGPGAAAGATAGAAEAPAATEAAAEPAAGGEQATPEPTSAVLGSGSERVVIWHSWGGTYFDAISKLLGEYATNNNVTVELLNVPNLNEKTNVAIPAGQGPDIVAWVNDQIGKNAELDLIQPLDDKGIDRAYLEQNFVPTAVEAMTYNEQVFGVPESMEAIAFIYNKDVVQEADLPKDTDELIQKATEFREANADKYYLVYQANGDPYHNAPWWYGFGAQYVDNEGNVGLTSPESISAGNFLKQLTAVMPQEVDYDVAKALITEGKAGIWLTGPWAVSDLQTAGTNFGVATIPIVTASGKPGAPFVGVKCMMLAQGAKNVDPAIKLMQYYGSTEFQSALAEANKQVPANTAAQDAVKDDPVIAAFAQQAANGVPLPNTPFMDAMWGPAGDAQKAIWTGSQTPEEALQAAQAIAEEKVAQIK